MLISELKNLNKIAILGFWREGKSTLAFLLKLWISEDQITILDKNTITLEIKSINLISWESYLNTLSNFDIIFKTPWISPYHECIKPYRSKLTSQTEVFFSNYTGKTIWITGTKGKSTISTLLHKTLLEVDYNVKLVGNIWTPVFNEIDLLDSKLNYNYVIYELSSYMLETFQPKCSIALLSNIYTCHLDRHNNDFWTYENAKLNILKKSDNNIISDSITYSRQNIYNYSTYWLEWKYQYSNKWEFYKNWNKILTPDNILLLWEHNKKNISGVIWILDIITKKYNYNSAWILSKMLNWLVKVLDSFSWLPHRLENIWKYKWIKFIDDGISTTPESTIEAINTFWDQINTIFLGWWDYGFTDESYELLRCKLVEYWIKNIVLFPDTWLDIFNISRWEKSPWDTFDITHNEAVFNILYIDSMKPAVDFAYKNTWENNICLMSCAAPSYSLWTWYEEKWREFKKYIELYK